MKAQVWGDKVDLVFADMRTWNPETKCDILVSELLGSFGDNELSPECLDGAQKFLKGKKKKKKKRRVYRPTFFFFRGRYFYPFFIHNVYCTLSIYADT